MAPIPCPFAVLDSAIQYDAETDVPVVDVRGTTFKSDVLASTTASRPAILTDLTVRPFDAGSVQSVLALLGSSCDAVLVGEHQNRPDFAPALMAHMIADVGARAWVTLTCRDRNRLVLEQDVAALRYLGADAVLCVTGDGRGPAVRPGVTQAFDLDGTRLAAMVSSVGLTAAVPESPQAPPMSLRPDRLLQKQKAGAEVCVLNHVGSPASVGEYVAQARRAGVTMPFVASVAVYTDEASAALLSRFPGLALDAAAVAGVLGADDPVEAGIAAAATEAHELLDIDGVIGVNLSGLASARGILYGAEVKAAVGHRIRESAA